MMKELKMTENNIRQYFDFQQLLKQFFLKNQCVSTAQLDCWLNRIKEKLQHNEQNDRIDRELAIINANQTLRSYGFAIKKVFCKSSDETFYTLINETEDALTAKSMWTRNENSFYYLLVDAIVKSFLQIDDNDDNDGFNLNEHLAIGMTSANNVARNTNITIILGEKILKNWINQYWFKKIDRGSKITLGVRTLTQKSGYLIRKYNLSACKHCGLVCFYGSKCTKCNICWHEKCLQSSNNNTCSSCNQPLSNNQICK
nr:uncharacterized protein LOC113799803 [Dermatophagoides pteronyssinus]